MSSKSKLVRLTMLDYRCPVKTVGSESRTAPSSPQEARRWAQALQEHVDLINPYPKPRGFVFKGRTYADYEAWRRLQKNPRLW